MDDFTPKGLKIEKTNDKKIIISTDKKELVLSDYFGIFFCCFGFAGWIFGLIETGFTDFYKMFSIIFLGLVGYLFMGLIFSFNEFQTITITNESIEIFKKRLIFSTKTVLDRKSIEKVDLKELKFIFSTVPSVVIMIKYACNLGYYTIPRIVYRGEDIYILEHYKKDLRVWIINYLNEVL